MYQKCPINGFEWVEDLYQFDESFIKNYDENSDKGYFFDIDAEYLKNLFNLHKDFPFLTERKKIKQCNKLICDIQDKENCVNHIIVINQALSLGLILKKVNRVIQFN